MSFESAKKFVEEKGDYLPAVDLGDKERHILTLLEAEETTITDPNSGEKREVMQWTVKEDGEKRQFITGAISLNSKLASMKKGDKVAIKRVSKKNEDGEWRTSYEVNRIKDKKVGDKDSGATTITEEDVPPEFA